MSGAKVSVEFASSGGGFMRQIQNFFPLGEPRLSGAEGAFEIPSPPAGQKIAVVARAQGEPQAVALGLVVFAAMVASCVVSGLAGALIPLTLQRLGADPATASSIFLTTATDVASMGMFLTLATVLVR